MTSHFIYIYIYIKGDQKVSVHLMITIQKKSAQRLFDHPVYMTSHFVCVCVCVCIYIYGRL